MMELLLACASAMAWSSPAVARASAIVGGGGVKERSSSNVSVSSFHTHRRTTLKCSSLKAT